ncbi:MAG: hypothetical protein ACJ751_02710, partial [Niastella sp.]|uniref:hypothetical protein n=1 Tax=Niastella sp. TaxID=1869183 RepID=UPI00389A95B6
MKKIYSVLLPGKYIWFLAILLLSAVYGRTQTNTSVGTTEYTIDRTAPAGTPRTFASFNDAYNFIKNGIDSAVVFNVAPNTGPYNEQLIMAPVPGASALNTISFNGNGNTIQFSSNNNTERAVIKLRGADFVTFDSLVIDATGSGPYGFGVQLLSNADSNTISRCIIKANDASASSYYNGIVINAFDDGSITPGNTLCDGNLFNRNTVTGGFSGVVLVGGTGSFVSGNKFTNNVIKNFFSYGMYIMLTSGTFIEGNDISRPNRTGSSNFYGIYLNNPSNSVYISGNRIHHSFPETSTSTGTTYAIAFNHASAAVGMENQANNNLIYKMYGQGAIYAVENISSDNILCYHNTISLDTGGSPYITAAFFQTGPTVGVVFRNNLVTVSRGGNGDKYAEYVDGNSSVTADHNDYYVTGPGSNYHIGYYKGTAYNTLSNWQTASAQDAHSVSEDPVYTDPLVTDNFTPMVASVDNLGEPVGVSTDINNAPRSATTPDIGCYEFTIPPCIAPPVAGTAVANPNTGVCLGTTISLTLTGNSSGGTQTYQWQSAPSATGPWTSISGFRYKKDYQTELTGNNYFRCIVICGGDTAYSTIAQVIMNPPLLSGVYTINPSAPAGTPNNFWSFTQAVAALDCGIGGWVTFDVAPGTYNEQIRMHKVGGASDTSRITFESWNGPASSVILTYNATSAANWVVSLDSAGYV